MPVLPCCPNLFQDRQELYQFLLICQQKTIEQNPQQASPQIISIATEIDRIDPLVALHELSSPNQPHFYIEKGFEDEAIAAVGAVAFRETEGVKRFSHIQKFIDACQSHLTQAGLTASPDAAPRFFCSFTFFDQALAADAQFAAATAFLPQWQIVRRQNNCIAIANLALQAHSDITTLTENLWQQFQTICLAKYGIFNLPDSIRADLNSWKVIDTHNFKTAVSSALKLIQHNHLNKLVVAHAIDVVSRFPFQWMESLHHLRQWHPDCYVFSTSNGQGQSFIGASPERLISVRDRVLVTDALAGSAPRGRTRSEDAELGDRLLNNEKERREHQVVADFIRQRLRHFGLTPTSAPVPNLLRLPNIQHLHTPIRAKMPNRLHPLEIVAGLHPTPAVAGMPRDIACEQIHHHEKFERSLYAAPLGWVDTQGSAEFIVGIRSALIEGCHARLYAGAGIVAGSNPDRELAEVKLKFQALLQALA